MSKNLSRKGLALGAIVALAASFFGGTAAFAADEVTLVPSGTSTLTKTIEGEEFKLIAGLAPAVPISNVVSLKYEVTTAFTDVAASKTANGTASTAAFTTVAATAVGSSSVTIVTPATPSAGVAQSIFLKATNVAAATPKSATVVAFLDSTPNGTKDAGEWQSAPITITWVDAADVTTNLTITAPIAGDSSVSGTVELVGVNTQQVQSKIGAVFSNNADKNVGVTNGAGATAAATATTSATTLKTAVWKSASANLVKGSVVKLQATFGGATGVDTAIGDALLVSAADRSITTITTAAVVASGVVTSVVGVATSTTSDTNGAVKVKTGTGFTFVASVGGAGVPVSVSVTENVSAAFSTTTGVTVAGTAYTSEAKLPGATGVDKLALTSDANGLVSVVVSTTGLVAADYISIVVESQNIDLTTRFTQEDSNYEIYEAEDVTGSYNRAAVAKSTTTVNYVVIDQFGAAPADSTYRLAVSVTSGAVSATNGAGNLNATTGRTTNTNLAYYPLVVAGKSTASIVDAGAGTGKQNVLAVLEKIGSNGNYSAVAESHSLTLNFLTAAAATKVTLDTLYNESYGSAHIRVNGSTSAADTDTTDSEDVPSVLKIASKDFGTYDSRLNKTATATSVDAAYGITFTGTASLSDVGQTVVPGGVVTVSAKGLQFTSGSGLTAVDTLSVYANGSGVFSFTVYSHTAGEQTITVASGTGSTTLKLTFKADASAASAIAFATATAAQAQTGRALDVSAVVTDKWGNVVEGATVKFSSTGAGYINNEAALTTSSKGVAASKLIAGASDLGTAYVSATLDIATDVVIAKSIELGETSVDAVAGGKRVFANVEFAKGKTVTVTIDGVRKYSKVADTDNAMELAFTQKKKGKHTVTVRAGSVVTTEVVVTK